MSNLYRREQLVNARTLEYDTGLRSQFQSVYNTIALGLVITGCVAYGVANIEPLYNAIFKTPLMYVAMFAPLAFAFFGFSHNAMVNKSANQLASLFYLFSTILGISMATLFVAYTGADVARVFFITASMFLATSIFGYVTKRDLSKMGSLLMMGAIGILIAMVVNLFLQSSMLQFAISGIGVIVYTGLTAWDTQQIKETYSESAGREANRKMAIFGALSLYMNFIMLFQFMMSLLSNRN